MGYLLPGCFFVGLLRFGCLFVSRDLLVGGLRSRPVVVLRCVMNLAATLENSRELRTGYVHEVTE